MKESVILTLLNRNAAASVDKKKLTSISLGKSRPISVALKSADDLKTVQ
jgi:hypothetical protein